MQQSMKSESIGNNSTYTNSPTNGEIFRLSIINSFFEQKDNPLSRTIHTLLRLFRKQSKPDSDKRENPPVSMHNTYKNSTGKKHAIQIVLYRE
ncbi:hypothetical protein EZS27_015904 [termite gut metagenome]|uniref:Uncharacterized protein n=1 Tax=termite gut metagenome TaxID=433724 RepID=A0A5J4RPQ5_9ZZZZ